MSDPWNVAANEIRRREAEAEQARRDAAEKEQSERAATQAAQEQAWAALQEAMQQATIELTRFLAERSAAAQNLLAAKGERAHVMFGSIMEGGGYVSVYFSGNGLCYEVGSGGSYNAKPDRIRAALEHEAVDMFARHGEGADDPQKVRTIVDWFTRKVNEYAS